MLEELSDKEAKKYKSTIKICKNVLSSLNSAKDDNEKFSIMVKNPEFETILICSRYLNFKSLLSDNIVLLDLFNFLLIIYIYNLHFICLFSIESFC